jgi:hypothetical protein
MIKKIILGFLIFLFLGLNLYAKDFLIRMTYSEYKSTVRSIYMFGYIYGSMGKTMNEGLEFLNNVGLNDLEEK